ncbi:MAG: SH3 domain-containing protein [Clostridia bacterium]|nr:SH3 domain-containing protein [Clostridia bacterium]
MKTLWRKFVAVPLALSLLLCMLLVGGTVALAAETGTVTGDYVNVREGASTSHKVLTQVNTGDKVTVLGSTKDGSGNTWYHITTAKGTTGYIYGTYVVVDVQYKPDADFEAYLTAQKFPDSYKPALRTLHAQYPNWVFVAKHLNLDWTTALNAESVPGKSLLIDSAVKANWKSMEYGAYDWDKKQYVVFDSGGWVSAQKEIVAFYMDPRNSLDATHIFQFESLSFSSAHTVDGVKKILSGCFMEKYAQAFYDIGRANGISPYHLASRARQEQGTDGNNLGLGVVKWTDSKGTVHDYTGYYNFFNIGAYEKDGLSAIQNGAVYAKSRGWNTPEKAIEGGAQQLAKGYINMQQDTLYLQKFDVVDGGNGYYEHQYMTNVTAAYAESGSMKKAYSDEMLKGGIVFNIPVYTNMPAGVCNRPVQADKNNDNTLTGLSVTGYSVTPTFSRYVTEYAVTVPASVTTLSVNPVKSDAGASVSGAGNITLSGEETTVSIKVTAPSGLIRTYTLHVYRPGGSGTPVLTSSKYKIETNITGIAPGTTATDLLQGMTAANGSAQIVTADGKPATGNAATGQVVQLLSGGKVMRSYPVVIYGDTSGDGAVTSRDLLIAQRHILGISKLSGAYLTAADSGKDGTVTSTDLLRSQKQILGITSVIL